MAGPATTKAPVQVSAITGHSSDSSKLKGRVDSISHAE
ncbi:hypothetical protein VCRA2112O188_170012 [Vibrio crassostreae]|nr:hypothetical protein VCRA2112O187_100012 [Vibrio crassostreae]CAK1753452.1 hypothetical protein VCRA2113O193_130089 [Vibrio crassostreae]CAK1802576.1 hypothetical protein VCRA2112O188_170012 [Vibrio crassostreae]CAK1810331.1 hypothetical protein VCRA2113O202_180011 [Vibrio crassostreae]CAK2164795.1 hypothetical protein VCRA2113O221_40279 [Vibrio crassostreae]